MANLYKSHWFNFILGEYEFQKAQTYIVQNDGVAWNGTWISKIQAVAVHVIHFQWHYSDVIMGAMASPITSLIIVYSTVYSGSDHSKHQSSASLAFVRGIHRWPVNSSHKWPVTRKMFPFDDVIMNCKWLTYHLMFVEIECRLVMHIRVVNPAVCSIVTVGEERNNHGLKIF